ncbi:helix-turn-helix domain-containing protein [Bacillus sp. V3B]|uniref:helix-turn-helix domain-containing protein n=1 Tax=Bacillus sp. V3B TaxID=2804915 RepID=UPI00210F177A|nr:helix-turn-helix domain-containing protein [Bacillus sp. V3B]MCQ6277298.1 helix-turn-helix domain-containing protein [Bacillus sp. V3B]
MDIKAINFEELRKHESFKNIDEMDESVRKYTEELRHDLPQSVVDILWLLGRSSLRCVGLSFMKQATIAKNTGYSRKTVNKALKKLESLGVIDSVRTKTKSGRPSVKIYRILPFCIDRLHQAVTSCEADEANNNAALNVIETFEPISFKQKTSLKTLDNKSADENKNKSIDKIDDIDPDQLNDLIPEVIVEKEFVDLAKPFFGTRKILSLSRALNNALKSVNFSLKDNYVFEAVESAFKSTVWSYKMNRIKGNFSSYFFGVLKSEFGVIQRRITRDKNPLFYNWLEA